MRVSHSLPTIRVQEETRAEPHTNLTILVAACLQPQNAVDTPHQTSALADSLLDHLVRKCHGRVIKAMRDAVIVEFDDPITAVHAAIEIERLHAKFDRRPSESEQPGLQIGVHGIASRCREIDVFSDVVHIATTIMKHAVSGQILISAPVSEVVSRQIDMHCQWFETIGVNGHADDGHMFEVNWAEAPAGIPSRYEVLSQIGSGGMGIVYKVRDRETDDIVVLKILKAGIAADPVMQENLKREVCLARKITHKNVCRIHEFNRSSGTAFISMEFVHGESLLSRLHRNGPIPWTEASGIAWQICSGLREAHLQGVVHRDLKPANIMADRSGAVKIMDFGIARSFEGTGHITGTLVGTPAYMAPEQVELRKVDARTDVYALGLLLYEMVTGKPAFEGKTPIAVALKHIREFPRQPREIVPELPIHAEAIILKCLQKDPDKRFQSVDTLAAALKAESRPKPAISMWASFMVDLRRTERDLHSILEPGIQSAAEILKRCNARVLKTKRGQTALGAGLAAVCLVSTLVMVAARPKKQAAAPALVTTPAVMDTRNTAPPVQWAVSSDNIFPPSSAFDAPLIRSNNVDLLSISDLKPPATNQKAFPVEPKVRSSQANQVSKQPAPVREIPTTVVVNKQRMAQPAIVAVATSSSDENSSNVHDLDHASLDLPASIPPDMSVDVPDQASSKENTIVDSSFFPPRYFEVGSFKDSAWAEHAIEKLTGIGLPAVSVRKSLLWRQSYEVRVGPYTNTTDFEAARQILLSQGFKPHQVK